MIISPSDQATLDSIEALLVAEKASVRESLEAAYKLGQLTMAIEITKLGEQLVAAVNPGGI
jgi:hypothetical protein